MRVRTELYHKAISVENPGQGALSNRVLESLTRGFQTGAQHLEAPKGTERVLVIPGGDRVRW